MIVTIIVFGTGLQKNILSYEVFFQINKVITHKIKKGENGYVLFKMLLILNVNGNPYKERLLYVCPGDTSMEGCPDTIIVMNINLQRSP